MLTPGGLVTVHFYCVRRKYMKPIEEVTIGFIVFFILDRSTRLASAVIADRRNLNDLETEKFRCTVETIVLLVTFAFLWLRLKK